MELMFNDLSLISLSADITSANEKMLKFSKTYAEANTRGFRKIKSELFAHQIMLSEGYSLSDWLYNKNVSRTLRDLVVGSIRHPYINDEDGEIVDEYILTEYFFEDSSVPIPRQGCEGLASAHLYGTISISMQSHPIWSKEAIEIIKSKDQKETRISVPNVSSPERFTHSDILQLIENTQDLELIVTTILPEDKNVDLSDHHGVQELKHLCKGLKQSDFVIEMKSTGWGGKHFIRKVHKTGFIEIVLYKTSKQYALMVQTTGRNYRETKAIADLLEERYS